MKKLSLFLAVLMAVMSFNAAAFAESSVTETVIAEFACNAVSQKSNGYSSYASNSRAADVSLKVVKTDAFKGSNDSVFRVEASGAVAEDGTKSAVTFGDTKAYIDAQIQSLLMSQAFDYVKLSFETLLGEENNSVYVELPNSLKIYIENADTTKNAYTEKRGKTVVSANAWHKVDVVMPWYGENVMSGGVLSDVLNDITVYVDGVKQTLTSTKPLNLKLSATRPTSGLSTPRIYFCKQGTTTLEYSSQVDNISITTYNGASSIDLSKTPLSLTTVEGVFEVNEESANITVDKGVTGEELENAVMAQGTEKIAKCVALRTYKNAVGAAALETGDMLGILDVNGNYKYYSVIAYSGDALMKFSCNSLEETDNGSTSAFVKGSYAGEVNAEAVNTDALKGNSNSVLKFSSGAAGEDALKGFTAYMEYPINTYLNANNYDFVVYSFDALLGAENNTIAAKFKAKDDKYVYIENADSSTNVWGSYAGGHRSKAVVSGGEWHRVDIAIPWYGEMVTDEAGKLKEEYNNVRIYIDGQEYVPANKMVFPETKPTSGGVAKLRLCFMTQTSPDGKKTPTYQYESYIDNVEITAYNKRIPKLQRDALKLENGETYVADAVGSKLYVIAGTTGSELKADIENSKTLGIAAVNVLSDYKTEVGEKVLETGNKAAIADENGIYKYYTVEVLKQSATIVSNEDFMAGRETVEADGYPAVFTTSEEVLFPIGEKMLSVSNGDTMLYEVILRSKGKSGRVEIDITDENGGSLFGMPEYNKYIDEADSGKNIYYITPSWSKICIPYVTTKNESALKINAALAGTDVEIASVMLKNCKTESTVDDLIKGSAGMYDQTATDKTFNIMASSVKSYAETTGLTVKGNYMYSIGSGTLFISDISGSGNPVITGKLENLGPLRQIEITDDEQTAIVTGRTYGVTLIDISDKTAPRILSRYDSVEFATGLDLYGNYMFIANRVFGVEIVDISNRENPKQVSIARCGEAQSCRVADGKLYAGLWGEHRIDIFDISDVASPELVGSVRLSGKGDGLTVETEGSGADKKTYLYAATGQNVYETSAANRKGAAFTQYGQGNGMDIFDVSDVKNPVWLSTVRTDGRFCTGLYDYWTTKIAKNNGRTYAYLASTVNGIYIYDVTDRRAPIRRGNITVSSTSSALAALTGVIPYDQTAARRSPISNFDMKDGVIYIGGTLTDVHVYENAELPIFRKTAEDKTTEVSKIGDFYSITAESGISDAVQYISSNEQIQAVAVENGYIYAACGTGGIKVFDEDLSLIKAYPADDIVSDIQIVNGIMYVAGGKAGLMFYEVEGSTLTKVGKAYAPSTVKQVQVTPNGKWAIIQQNLRMAVVDVSDLSKPQLNQLATYGDKTAGIEGTNSASVYIRQIMQGFAQNRYGVVYGYTGTAYVIDFGENFASETPQVVKTIKPGVGGVVGGLAAAGDKIVAIPASSNRFLTFEPLDSKVDWTKASFIHELNGQILVGKPVVFGNTLVVSDIKNGHVVVADITDIYNPVLKASFDLNGNPNIAYANDEYVLLPMGYQGLMKFTFADKGITLIKNNGDIKIGANTGVWQNNTGTAALMLAEYDENDCLKNARVLWSGEYGDGRSVYEASAETIGEGLKAKVFLVDKNTMMPLCGYKAIKD